MAVVVEPGMCGGVGVVVVVRVWKGDAVVDDVGELVGGVEGGGGGIRVEKGSLGIFVGRVFGEFEGVVVIVAGVFVRRQ